jgi:hypothetical protein
MNAQEMPTGSATTTEELIVQYLDGELQRKELETVLFERLARNADARQLLREHLVIRGAIRNSMDHEQFELSDELDQRTRARIEEALKALPTTSGLPDAEPVRIDPTKRRLQRWSVRPAYAALLLVFAVGATWLLARNSGTEQVAQVNQPTNSTQTDVAQANQPSIAQNTATKPDASVAAEPTKVVYKDRIVEKPVIHYVNVAKSAAPNDIAQNVTPSAPTAKPAEESNPADIMISRRFGKLLNETAKKEVIVTTHDRL